MAIARHWAAGAACTARAFVVFLVANKLYNNSPNNYKHNYSGYYRSQVTGYKIQHYVLTPFSDLRAGDRYLFLRKIRYIIKAKIITAVAVPKLKPLPLKNIPN